MEEARAFEKDYMDKLGVYTESSKEACWAATGAAPIGARLVDIDKGQPGSPQVRSRLVAQETRRVSTFGPVDAASLFSATPPLEVRRLFQRGHVRAAAALWRRWV